MCACARGTLKQVKTSRCPGDGGGKTGGDILDEFPVRLRRLREKQHKSRKTVSELCGLPPGAIRKYERREAKPSMESLIAIANYFEVSIDYLVGRTNY